MGGLALVGMVCIVIDMVINKNSGFVDHDYLD
jgi:hypothetical protein